VKQYVYTNFSYTFNGFYVHALSSDSCPSVSVLPKQASVSSAVFIWQIHRVVASGGAVLPGPPFEIGAPPFHFWPTGCCIYPILYFENVAPFWFLAPLLLNLGDGPANTWCFLPEPCVLYGRLDRRQKLLLKANLQ